MPMRALGVDVRNPYASTDIAMHISSDPLSHHCVVGGDFATDINMAGTLDAGNEATFDVVPTDDAREVRGLVSRGGGTSWVACSSGDPNDGGWALQVRIEARAAGGEWQAIGMLSLLHLEEIPEDLRRDSEVHPGDRLGVATGRFGGTCSTGPHLHCEVSATEGRTLPVARFGDLLSESSVIFSVGRVANDDEPGPQPSALPAPALVASSLSQFYSAMGRSLPRKVVRANIYAALGLGPADSYRGTADQNTALLKALKQRALAPRSPSEVQ